MDNKVVGYNMTKEEMITKIIEQAGYNTAVNLKVDALTSLLIDKKIIREDEIQEYHKHVITSIQSNSNQFNVNSSNFIKFLEDFFDLDDTAKTK